MTSVKIMGILNVTPDSFSDGGLFNSPQAALTQTQKLVDAGADIIDVGGESTRPFSRPVSVKEELERTIPVIKVIRSAYQDLPISIDTRNAKVAEEALAAGANIINDISALQHDDEMIPLIQRTDVPVIIMHMQNTPEDMQVTPEYDDVVNDIYRFFEQQLERLRKLGIDIERITIDPGIGFGKTLAHNLSLLKHLEKFNDLGRPVLLGHSRKRFLGELTQKEERDRDFATAVVSALAVNHSVSILRVHNVAATREAVILAEAIKTAD